MGSYGLFCTYTEDALYLSKHITLKLLSLSLDDVSFVLSSFTSGRPRLECSDTEGSVGKREGYPSQELGTNSVTSWEQSLEIPRDKLWDLSASAAGRSPVAPAQTGIHQGREKAGREGGEDG